MKLLYVGSYPTKGCGVSRYQEALLPYLKPWRTYKLNFLQTKDILEPLKLLKFIKKNKPTHVLIEYTPTLVGPLFPLIIKRIAKYSKVIINSHEDIRVYKKYLGPLFFVLKLYESKIAKNVIFCTHTEDHKKFVEESYGLKSTLVPMIVEKPKVKNKNKKQTLEEHNIHYKKINLLQIGQIKYKKGIEESIIAYKRLPKKIKILTNLIIIGRPGKKDNGYYNRIRKLAKNEGIYFTGFIKDEEIPNFLSFADIILLPYKNCTNSYTLFNDAIPYKIPVIATRKGILGEIEKMGVGKNIETIGEISSAICEIITSKFRYNNKKFNSQNPEKIAEQIVKSWKT